MIDKKPLKTPLNPLYSWLFDKYQVKVWVKRDDLNHPWVQGNKWHKLKYNIQQAHKMNKTTLLTFGGAYSNHIAATAAAAKSMEFKSIGFIRGDELANHPERWSHTLKTAANNGMQLQFIDRENYRQKSDKDTLRNLQLQFPQAYILPEGGSNDLAVLGFDDLMTETTQQCPDWTHLFTATGTGGTLAGLVHASQNLTLSPNTYSENKPKPSTRNIFGVAVLKNAEYLIPQIQNFIDSASKNISEKHTNNSQSQSVKWTLLTQYHGGGYAKQNPNSAKFQIEFENQFSILLDPIYTNKMVSAFYQELKNGNIKPGSNIILLHTGGLQGRTCI